MAVHINENSILNISFNVVTDHCAITSKEYADFEICAIQYISKRGNLDKEFQTGQNLNYSIIIDRNNLYKTSSNNLKHCMWDSTSAFLTSSPLHVNQRFIQHNFSAWEEYKKGFVCAKKIIQ